MSCDTIQCILTKINVEILNPIITILFVLATILFFWGVIKYVIGSQGNESQLAAGKKIMMWGIIGLTIMASAWGIVKILCDFFGTCEGSTSSSSSYDRSAFEEQRRMERNPEPSSFPSVGDPNFPH